MTKTGLYTVKKAGLVSSGLALNFLLVALLLLSTSSAHADDRGWRADRHGGYFNNRSHWKAAGGRHYRRNWGLNRGGFNRGWGHSAWRGARHRNSQIFIGGARPRSPRTEPRPGPRFRKTKPSPASLSSLP